MADHSPQVRQKLQQAHQTLDDAAQSGVDPSTIAGILDVVISIVKWWKSHHQPPTAVATAQP